LSLVGQLAVAATRGPFIANFHDRIHFGDDFTVISSWMMIAELSKTGFLKFLFQEMAQTINLKL
jgi:hypothetical protein